MKWMRKIIAPMLTLVLLVSTMGLAMALPTSTVQDKAFERLSALKIANGIARGDGTVDPALGEPITRAQMMAVIVRAFGAEPLAVALKGTKPFPDINGSEWFSGYVTVAVDLASKKGATIGRPDGRFDGDAQVTAAEVLAFTMKFLGVPRDTSMSWPMDYIQGALKAGMITPADQEMYLDFPSVPVSRGWAFALADSIFYNYKGLAGNNSVYTAYVDPTAPTITLGTVPEKTEAETLTITGRVEADAISLTMGTQSIKPSANGTFSVKVPLSIGANLFEFEAVDLAGNKGVASATVSRTEPAPVGPVVTELKVSKSVAGLLERVTLTAYDEAGNEIKEDVTFSAESTDAVISNGNVFQATQPGRYVVKATTGIIFATAVIDVYGTPSRLEIEAPEIVANGIAKKTVKVYAVDASRTKVLSWGSNGEKVTLEGVGVTIYDKNGVETNEVEVVDGAATFQITLSPALAGEMVTLTARHEGTRILTGSTSIYGSLSVASGIKVEGPSFLAANKSVTTQNAIKVWVVDQDGAPVDDIYGVSATATGPGELVTTEETYIGSDSPAYFDVNNWNTVGITGVIRLTFTVDGVGSATHLIEHKIAGSPAKLAVEPAKASMLATDDLVFTVTVQDRNGIPVSLSDATETQLSVVLPDAVADKFELLLGQPILDRAASSATFTLKATEAFLGDLKVTVNAPGLTGVGTVKVLPGAVDSRSFDREKAMVAVMNPQAAFVGFVSDSLGNPVPAQGVTMKAYALEVASSSFTSGTETKHVQINGQLTTPQSPVTLRTDAQGKVQLNVQATPYAGKTYVIVLTDQNGSDATYAHLVVVSTVPGALEVETWKLVNISDGQYLKTTNVKAGDEFIVKVRVKDTYGGPVRGVSNELQLVSPDVFSNGTSLIKSSQVVFQSFFDLSFSNPDDVKLIAEMGLEEGDYIARINGGLSGVQKVTVRYNLTVEAVTSSANIDVKPADFAKLVINDGKPVKIKVNTVNGFYRLQLTDRFGNATATTTTQEVIWTVRDENGIPAGTAIGFRLSASGANVTQINTRSFSSFYIDVNQLGIFTIEFISGDARGEFEVEVVSR